MPYKTKSPYKKRKMAPISTKALERRVKALENAPELKTSEFKIQDTLISTLSTTKLYGTSGALTNLTELAKGTGISERIGTEVTWKKMFLRYNNLFAGLAVNYRTAIVWDKEGDSGVDDVPFYNAIFASDGLSDPSYFDPQSGVNLSNRDRFRVLYDSINSRHPKSQMQLSVATGDASALQTIVRDTGETYIDLRNCVSVYDGFSDSTGNKPRTGTLYLVTIANQLENSTEPAAIAVDDYLSQINIRMRYTDV